MSLNVRGKIHPAVPIALAGATRLLACVLLFAAPRLGLAQEVPGGCGTIAAERRMGPFDYRSDKYVPEKMYGSHKRLLGIVESNHFTPEVESLTRGKTTYIGGDLSYTLHAFPNHHRALISMAALSEKQKTDKPQGSPYPVECWFKRAIVWRPDDNIVRMIYASFLQKVNRREEAEQQLNIAANQAGDNAFTHHNIGLVYFDMKNYEKALFHAHLAYRLGLDNPTLREQLRSARKWMEPSDALPLEPANLAPEKRTP